MKKRLLFLRSKANKLSLLGATFLFLLLMQVSAIYAQNAIRAEHGNGKYKNQIYWLKWGNRGEVIENGKTVTFSTDLGLKYTVTVSNVTTDNSAYPPQADIYNSWSENNFPIAYNFGTGSGSGYHYGYKDEVISIVAKKGATVSFDLNISAVITGTSTAVQDFAFVLAGSETLANNTEYYSIEALAPISDETVIQPIETYVYSSDFQLDVESSNGGKKLLATNPAADNVTEDGRGDVIFAATHVQNIKVTIKGKTGPTGKGSQAIALGLIDLLDWGDAPNTYEQPTDGTNNARHYSLPSLGGTPWPDGTTNWTSQPSAEGLVSLEEPLLGLGNYLDVEDTKYANSDATGDDTHFVEGSSINDEDAIPGLKWFKDCDGAVKVHNAHKTKTGYLYVWIDANGDNKFSNDEKYASSIPVEPGFDGIKYIDFRNGFGVPNFQPTEGLERILRFRLSYDNTLDVSGLSTSGEIEDHLIKFVVPKVTPLTTHINSCADPKADDIFISNLPQTGWTITQTGTVNATYKGIGADTTLSLGAGAYNLNISNNAPACGYDFHLNIAGDVDCDGVFDDTDLDNDNDGILDTDEGEIECTSVGTNLSNYEAVGQPVNGYPINGEILNTNIPGVTIEHSYIGDTPKYYHVFSGYGYDHTVFQGVEGDGNNDNTNATSTFIYTFNKPIANLEVDLRDLDHSRVGRYERVKIEAYYNGVLVTNKQVQLGSDVVAITDGYYENQTSNVTETDLAGRLFEKYFSLVNEVRVTATSNWDGGCVVYFSGGCLATDTDGDGTPDYLDLDSDGDGCPDAIEGNENITAAQLDGDNRIDIANQGGVDEQGVPTLVNNGGSADADGNQGQGVGTSQQANNSACYIKTYNDINQTTEGESISGDLFVNDVIDNVNATTLVSAQCYDNNGNLISLPLDETETDVYVKDPNNPGSYIKAGTIKIKAIDGTYTFKPENGFTGDVPFTYTAQNSVNATDTAILDIKVLPNPSSGNNPPIAQDDTYTVEQGDTNVEVPLLENDSDIDGHTLSVIEVKGLDVSGNPITLTASEQNVYAEDPNNPGAFILAGTAKLVGNEIVFSPALNFTGDVPFDYTIDDSKGGEDTAQVVVTVLPDNNIDNIYANDDANTGKKGKPISGGILENDNNEGASGTLTVNGITVSGDDTPITLPGSESALTFNPDGTYTFIPNPNFVGTVTVPYEVCNAEGQCDKATLYLTTLDRATCSFLRSNRNVTRQLNN